MSLSNLVCFLLLSSFSYSIELKEVPIETRILKTSLTLKLAKLEENVFVSHHNSSQYFTIPKDSKIFDFTLPIKNKSLLRKAKKNDCTSLDSLYEVSRNKKCLTFFNNFLKEKNILFIASLDANQVSLKNKTNCLNITNSLLFHQVQELSFRKFELEKENPFRCDFRYANELFLVDYIDLSITSIKKRSQEIFDLYVEKNLNANFIQDFKARRFIDRKDWEEAVSIKKPLEKVYDPAPHTWEDWEKIAYTEVLPFSLSSQELNIDQVIKWNLNSIKRETLLDSNGNLVYPEDEEVYSYLRKNNSKGWVVGTLKYKAQALTKKEIKRVINFKVDNHELYNPLGWAKTPCVDGKVENKECGKIVYAPPKDLSRYLRRMIKTINKKLEKDLTDQEYFEFAIHMQKQIVALHPFVDGNGRVSRFVMDYITLKTKLPYIIYYNMNNDLTEDPKKFQLEAKRGMFHGVLIKEYCLNSKLKICRY